MIDYGKFDHNQLPKNEENPFFLIYQSFLILDKHCGSEYIVLHQISLGHIPPCYFMSCRSSDSLCKLVHIGAIITILYNTHVN